MAPVYSCLRIGGLTLGREHPEPGPFRPGIGVFSPQTLRQGDSRQIVAPILLKLLPGQTQLLLQIANQAFQAKQSSGPYFPSRF